VHAEIAAVAKDDLVHVGVVGVVADLARRLLLVLGLGVEIAIGRVPREHARVVALEKRLEFKVRQHRLELVLRDEPLALRVVEHEHGIQCGQQIFVFVVELVFNQIVQRATFELDIALRSLPRFQTLHNGVIVNH